MKLPIPKGGVIFQQGDKADSFYLIYGGSVRIVRRHRRKGNPACAPGEGRITLEKWRWLPTDCALGQ